jgi:hypothetical protein
MYSGSDWDVPCPTVASNFQIFRRPAVLNFKRKFGESEVELKCCLFLPQIVARTVSYCFIPEYGGIVDGSVFTTKTVSGDSCVGRTSCSIATVHYLVKILP